MKRKQEHAKLATLEAIEPQKVNMKVLTLENEIECPRCRDTMVLFSGFDYLYYSCDECGFVLSIHRA